MPLTAYLDGQSVESFGYTSEQWNALRSLPAGRLTLRNGRPAVLKRSIRGLQFFAHPPGGRDPDYQPESVAHLQMKADLALALRQAGLAATVEAPGQTPDGEPWQADVLAEGMGRRVAFEVQLSQQTLEDYEIRSRRYHASRVEVVWLVRAQHFGAFGKALYYRNPGQQGHPEFPAFPVRMPEDKHHSGTIPGPEVIIWPADRPVAQLSPGQLATGILLAAPDYVMGRGWIWRGTTA